MVSAGKKILSAAHQIHGVADDQTGTARNALYRMAEFFGRSGAALQGMTSIEEGAHVSEAFPTVQEFKHLLKEMQKLEK